MKAIGIKNVLKFDFLDQPNMALVLQNLNQLQKLDALDCDVTPLRLSLV
jgi:HrpA-like RNA helicase